MLIGSATCACICVCPSMYEFFVVYISGLSGVSLSCRDMPICWSVGLSVYFLVELQGKHKALKFYGRWKGSGQHSFFYIVHGSLTCRIRRLIQQYDIYSSITMRVATTKIPHLLCGTTYLKYRMECVILFTIYGLFTRNVIWWGWEKDPEKYKNQYEN